MAENNINFRSINEVETAEFLADGDKVILNSGGITKQIDASRIGGGGGILYAQMISTTECYLYADEGHTQMLKYSEAKKAIMLGATTITELSGNMVVITPLATTCLDGSRVFQSTVMLTQMNYLTLYCSDSAIET